MKESARRHALDAVVAERVEAHRAQDARTLGRLEGKRPERQGRHHGPPTRQDARFEAHRPEAAFEHALASQLLGLGHAGDPPQALRPIRADA